ncbi:MAG: HAMP domain-containing protein [Acidimicrobiia bacterium]|nr:HAMP domain-containing protein [Acidimicrobiia bacterium]
MPASISPFVPRPSSGAPTRPTPAEHRPLWDSPRRLLVGIALLAGALAGILTVASRSAASPDFLSEFVLYALLAADLTMLVALLFVLARHIVKLVVERRRGRPFASLRGKLVALLLGMTLAPAVLVLAVGSEIIRTNMDRWFTAPMDEVLAAANELVGDYRRERQAQVNRHAERVARGLVSVDLTAQDQRALRDRLLSDLALSRDITLQVYRVAPLSGSESELVPVFDVAGNTLPVGYSRDTADRLAAKALTGADELRVEQRLADDTALLHAAATVNVEDGRPVGVVVATDVVTGAIVARSRQMTSAYEQYSQLRVLKRPLTGVYLSFFLMVTLMILVGALWMGVYLAKRITRPVQLLAAAAREIGAGHLDQRI